MQRVQQDLRLAVYFQSSENCQVRLLICSMNLIQANLGGNPSRKARIQAYLRMREKDAGPLDFDTPGGLDTTWHRIFFCLRSAYTKEALEVSIGLK